MVSTNVKHLPRLMALAPRLRFEEEMEQERKEFLNDDDTGDSDDELPPWMETEEEWKNRFPRELTESEIDEMDELSEEEFDGMFGEMRRPFLTCLDEHVANERKRQLGEAIHATAADYAERNGLTPDDTIFVVVDSEQDARVGNEALEAFRKATASVDVAA